jgi:DNA helicase-2/ATP-dependent DNA helicase PcrA
LARWLPDHRDSTVAVLVPRNARGVEMITALKHRGIEYLEFLASTSNTRAAAGALSYMLTYLSDPQSSSKLSRAYRVWRRDWREDAVAANSPAGEGDDSASAAASTPPSTGESVELETARRELMEAVTVLLRKMGQVEAFIAPNPENDWLAGLQDSQPAAVLEELENFRVHVRRWLEAVTLPIEQLVLTLAQDIFTSVADIALAQKLASILRRAAADHSDWRLPELTDELKVIARNERRFIGFDPERHKGRVVVSTMHKAKGLEWDRVYLLSVNNYDFPSALSGDQFISERWFLQEGLNLEAEALAQLEAAFQTGPYDWYAEGQATNTARLDYAKERLRLLYVGITRARRELFITWNTGRRGDQGPALPLTALTGFTERWAR